jgi:threonine dehydrogenase-like Zn-dependent dehydrogenase
MKKLIMQGPKKASLVDVPMPEIVSPDHVLVKNRYCGVCMSEHYAWSTAEEGKSFGHEPIGTVVAVGDAVTKVKVGDRVSGLFWGQAEYAIAKEADIFAIPDGLRDSDAILEPLSCLVSAVSKVRIPVVGDRVAVVGCGYMGCGAISLLKARGAYVVAVDIRPESLENAKRFGADEVYTPDQLPAHYKDVPGQNIGFQSAGLGFKTVMEWGETNESLDLAINMTRMCGQLCIGAYHTGGKRLVDVQQLNVKAIDCLSTHPREVDINRTACQNAINMLMDGTWKFKNVPTKVYPIAKFDQAQEELETKYGKYMKAMVDFEAPEDMEPYII